MHFFRMSFASLSYLTSFSKSKSSCCSGVSWRLLETSGSAMRINLSSVEYSTPSFTAIETNDSCELANEYSIACYLNSGLKRLAILTSPKLMLHYLQRDSVLITLARITQTIVNSRLKQMQSWIIFVILNHE